LANGLLVRQNSMQEQTFSMATPEEAGFFYACAGISFSTHCSMGAVTLESHGAECTSLAIHQEERSVILARKNDLVVWDLQAAQVTHVLEGHSAHPFTVDISSDGQRAVSAGAEDILKVWNLQTGRALASIELEASLWSVDWAPDDITILARDATGNVYCLHYVDRSVPSRTTISYPLGTMPTMDVDLLARLIVERYCAWFRDNQELKLWRGKGGFPPSVTLSAV
jgi:WD40 repeat protein